MTRQQRRAHTRAQRKADRHAGQRVSSGMVLASGVALSLGMGLASQPVEAASFTVINLNDDGAGSLRQAIVDANSAAGTDTIRFQEGLTGTITLTTGQLEITDSLDLEGPGAATITVSGNNASKVFYIYSATAELDVSISGLTITGGNDQIGAGIFNANENLTLDSVTITSNTATNGGGGIWASGNPEAPVMDLTILNSTISGNTAGTSGGGIYIGDTGGPLLIQNTVISGNTATGGAGGGVYLYAPDNNTTIENSTLSGNTSQTGGGGIFLYFADAGTHTIRRTTISGNTTGTGGGGALFDSPFNNPVVLENSTISGNTVTACDGGGVFFGYATASTVRHTTVASNSATGTGGGIVAHIGSVTLDHTIVADNTVASVANDLGTPFAPSSGRFTASFSLIEVPGTADIIIDTDGNALNVDPQLGKLANNGGPTLTHLPANASPAVNTGNSSIAAPPSTDQRGLTRIVGTAIDMGAVETVVVPVTLQGFEVE